ncbi:MAG: class I SAM-dependent methyltransferase [Myxococcales bacterium]
MDTRTELPHENFGSAALSREFDTVASRYDLLNALNPGYRKHLAWSAERLRARPDAELLDLCCGTGLSTQALLTAYPGARISALDASAGMLAVAAKKPALTAVRFLLGDATDPAAHGASGPFDGILMAYGIRNVPDKDLCLRHLKSLLKPGGRVAFHEYSVADSALARAIWNAVSSTVIVPLGSSLSRAPELFRYLRRSVNEFDGVRAFVARLERAGFGRVEVLPMDGWQRGVTHTFVAEVIA